MPTYDFIKAFGDKVRTTRHQMKLTQDQLAELANISSKYIGKIEKAEVNPSLEIIATLAHVLQFSLDEVINPDLTAEEKDCKELIAIYLSCPTSVRKTLHKSFKLLASELTSMTEQNNIK